jgi:hypothetical protein
MVVGTVHKAHLTERSYPLALLARVLRAYRPDLVLVEIRPAPFQAGHYEDGPFEMAYVVLQAVAAGIAVEPIDRWRSEDLALPVSPESAACAEERRALEARRIWPPSFVQANGNEQARVLLAFHNLAARCDGDGAWNRRQAWFHHQAEAAITRHHACRVLAFVGQDHRPELEQFLRTGGFHIESPLELHLQRNEALIAEPAPPLVVDAWREGVVRMRAELAAASAELAAALDVKIRYFEAAIESRGRCCVAPSTL